MTAKVLPELPEAQAPLMNALPDFAVLVRLDVDRPRRTDANWLTRPLQSHSPIQRHRVSK